MPRYIENEDDRFIGLVGAIAFLAMKDAERDPIAQHWIDDGGLDSLLAEFGLSLTARHIAYIGQRAGAKFQRRSKVMDLNYKPASAA